MRELIYYVASTIDGFIARADGSLGDFPWDPEFGAALQSLFPETFPAHLRGGRMWRDENRLFDTVIMGRATYEVGLRAGVISPYPTLRQIVFSSSLADPGHPEVTVVRTDAMDGIADLKRSSGRPIWLCGGSRLAGSAHRAGLIDRILLKLNPVLFGCGKPLFEGVDRPVRLTLTSERPFASGHVLLDYRVDR